LRTYKTKTQTAGNSLVCLQSMQNNTIKVQTVKEHDKFFAKCYA